MKLLIFCPYYPPHIGGLENHAQEFNSRLSGIGYDITVVTPHIPLDTPTRETEDSGVRVIRFPAIEVTANYPIPKFWQLQFWQLAISLYKKDFDIVVSRTRFFSTSLLALFFAKTTHTPWVHIEHGSGYVQLSSKLKTLIARLYDMVLGRLIFVFSDKIIAISEAVRAFVLKFYKGDIAVIYRGINMEFIDNVAPADDIQEKYKDKLIILTVGRLYHWKGTQYAIEAVNNLPEKEKQDIVFLIIGDGEDYQQILKQATNPTELLGSQTHKRTLSIMKIADIYLHPSLPGGGLSTSLLEAMYCNTAIVSTPEEGANEVIEAESNGLLVSQANAKEMTERIQLLLQDKDFRLAIASKARQTVKERFSWVKSITAYNQLLSELHPK